MKTFDEMIEAINQKECGLLTVAELIELLQCDVHQQKALRQHLDLPGPIRKAISLRDWDVVVADARERSKC